MFTKICTYFIGYITMETQKLFTLFLKQALKGAEDQKQHLVTPTPSSYAH